MARLAILLAICTACAAGSGTPQKDILVARTRDPAHPLFLGHTASGEIVMASTHADAMRGMAVSATNMGAPRDLNGDDLMICRKEELTGTHMPTWICRYPSEVERQHLLTQDFYDHPRNCSNCGIR